MVKGKRTYQHQEDLKKEQLVQIGKEEERRNAVRQGLKNLFSSSGGEYLKEFLYDQWEISQRVKDSTLDFSLIRYHTGRTDLIKEILELENSARNKYLTTILRERILGSK